MSFSSLLPILSKIKCMDPIESCHHRGQTKLMAEGAAYQCSESSVLPLGYTYRRPTSSFNRLCLSRPFDSCCHFRSRAWSWKEKFLCKICSAHLDCIDWLFNIFQSIKVLKNERSIILRRKYLDTIGHTGCKLNGCLFRTDWIRT